VRENEAKHAEKPYINYRHYMKLRDGGILDLQWGGCQQEMDSMQFARIFLFLSLSLSLSLFPAIW
jgi:hypothetical protein